ncbi:hypothetical protein AAZX31_04G113000 [Glycine max]
MVVLLIIFSTQLFSSTLRHSKVTNHPHAHSLILYLFLFLEFVLFLSRPFVSRYFHSVKDALSWCTDLDSSCITSLIIVEPIHNLLWFRTKSGMLKKMRPLIEYHDITLGDSYALLFDCYYLMNVDLVFEEQV